MGKNTQRVQCWKNKYKKNYKNSITTDMFHVESEEEKVILYLKRKKIHLPFPRHDFAV